MNALMRNLKGIARFCFGLGIVWSINYQGLSNTTTLIFIAMISFGAMFGWE